LKRATLLYNPLAGSSRNQQRRRESIESAARALRAAGVEAICTPTESAESGGEQARHAIVRGSDTILACGGDGTLHDVLQGVVGSDTALGVIPLGTANALAYDLRIPFHPARAATTLTGWFHSLTQTQRRATRRSRLPAGCATLAR